jgi:hypothetical protein
VFQPGETRPSRPAKKKATKKEGSAKKEATSNGTRELSPGAKKRKLDEDDLVSLYTIPCFIFERALVREA